MLTVIKEGLVYSEALRQLWDDPDKIVIKRKRWNNRYIFMRPGDTIPLDVAMRAVSIPLVTKELIRDYGGHVRCTEYLAEWCDGCILNDIDITTSDLSYKDWIVMKLEV